MSRTIGRRTVLGMTVGLAAPAIVRAEGYPAHPVRIVNAYSPGGTADVVIRGPLLETEGLAVHAEAMARTAAKAP